MPKPTSPDDKRLARKPVSEKFVPRLITLPPALSARLDKWQADNPKGLSPMIAELIDNYLTQKGY